MTLHQILNFNKSKTQNAREENVNRSLVFFGMKDILEGSSEPNPALMTREQLQQFYSKNLNWFEKIVGMNEEEFQKNVALDKVRLETCHLLTLRQLV
jgi:hypothetical protein